MSERRPIQRHPLLQPLSREHMGGLAQARALGRVAAAAPDARAEVVRAFLEAWQREIRPHFADEEAHLLPLVARAADRARLLAEHRAIRELVERVARAASDGGASEPDLRALGAALHDHIRWEERELFEHVQDDAGEGGLSALAPVAERITRERPGSRTWRALRGPSEGPPRDRR